MAERLEVSKTESVMEATIIKEPVTETKNEQYDEYMRNLSLKDRPMRV